VSPLLDADGSVVGLVAADIPAAEGVAHPEGLHGTAAQTFASMLQTAAAQAGRAEIEAITDGLTGLHNHRYFDERLNEEIERCAERGTELALLCLDLDDFRAFSERRGHSAGDGALRNVARIIEESVRRVDLVARFGGEELREVAGAALPSGPLTRAQQIVALATACQAMVVERQYRTRVSGAEALSELLGRPALLYDRKLATAFGRVLSG
jgi:two-component system cell cycle response regulator